MHFVGLTYWQDAQCQFPVFAVFVFQKITFGNIFGIGRKFTANFYAKEYTTTLKGDLGCTQGLGTAPNRSPTRRSGWDPPLPPRHLLGPLRRL